MSRPPAPPLSPAERAEVDRFGIHAIDAFTADVQQATSNVIEREQGDPRAVLDQLDELQAAATPGPWQQLDADPAYIIGQVVNGGEEYLDVADTGIRSWTPNPDWPTAEADAALIVAAVNQLPALVAAVRATLDLADEMDADLVAQGFRLDRCIPPGDRLRAVVADALAVDRG